LVTIVVSGKSSNIGKSTLISQMIKNLNCHVGVIKTSLHKTNNKLEVTKDPLIINEIGKDTELFKKSGAQNVILIKTNYEGLLESYRKARKLLDEDIEYLIIEGNSILDFIRPTLIFYIDSEDLQEKKSSIKAKKFADIVIDKKNLEELIKNGNSMKFDINFEQISCFNTHVLCKALNIQLPKFGKLLYEKNIKIRYCQLGLFK
jgi:molybdopterin-guanine dinucleotide biosynthesis protein